MNILPKLVKVAVKKPSPSRSLEPKYCTDIRLVLACASLGNYDYCCYELIVSLANS